MHCRWFLVLSSAHIVACSLDVHGTSEPVLPARDAEIGEAGTALTADGGRRRPAGAGTASDPYLDAASPAAILLRCGDDVREDCDGCPGKPLPCVFCRDGGAPQGVCVAASSPCRTAVLPGHTMCPCAFPDPAGCPAPYQVCHDGSDGVSCRTCGEANTVVEADRCRAGGTCKAALRCE
jgi:hypothetical protein